MSNGHAFNNQSRAERLAVGDFGVVVESGTTAVTGRFGSIQVLVDANFSTFTENNASGDAMTGFVIPAGVVLMGEITAFTLSSGTVRAYVGWPDTSS